MSDSRPIPVPSVCGSSRWVLWWPPASMPCTQTASAPHHWAVWASSAVVTVTTVKVPARSKASSTSREGQPKVNETTGTGSSTRIASLASYPSSALPWTSPSGVSYQVDSPAS